MIWLRRNLPLLVGILLFVGLAAWAALLFVRTKSAQSQVESKHRELEQKLNQLVSMDPFPSQDNIEKLRAQTQLLASYYKDLHDRFPRPQKEYSPMSRWDFRAYIGTRLDRLRQECVMSNRVQVASTVTFGFGRYLGNVLVKEEDTPKLLHQLDLIESLVRLLAKSKITEITAVRRTYLEGETDTTRERVEHGVWNTDPALIYESQTVEVEFRCPPEQLKVVMNNLARSTNPVVVVRSLAIEADRATPREPTAAGGAGAGTPAAAFPPGMPGAPAAPFPPVGGRGGVPDPSRPASGRPGAETATAEPGLAMGFEMASVTLRLDLIEMKPTEEEKGKAKEDSRKSPPKRS